jgi:hypothetical protein
MLLQVKATNLIIKPTTVLFGVLFITVLALVPISAGAQCSTKWLASGHEVVSIMQRGQRYGIHLSLVQKGRVITGTASHQTSSGVNKGTVDGTIDGDSFRVQIFWNNGQTGVYIANVLPSGRLDGEGYEKNSPNVRPTWHSVGVLKCAPPPHIQSPINPFKFPNKKPPSKPASPPPTPPFIIASQPIIPTPHHPFGILALSWDGGPDHPNVEVFLSMDNGTEVPAFSTEHSPQSLVWKQPKTSIQLNLQRKHHYRFVLKGAGKTLSTAAFVVQ